MGQPRLRGGKGPAGRGWGGEGGAAPRPRPCRAPEAGCGRLPTLGGSPGCGEGRRDAESPETDGQTDGRGWEAGVGAGPGTLRGGPGFEGGRPGSCAGEAGGGLGVPPSTMGLRCPGAHRVPVSPVPKAVLGGGRPAAPLLGLSATTVVPGQGP